jgi:hypothetical protein
MPAAVRAKKSRASAAWSSGVTADGKEKLGDVDGLPHVTCVGFLERSLSDSWSAD